MARLQLPNVNFEKRLLQVVEKGGYTHGYKISKQGLGALRKYLEEERGPDVEHWQAFALFLPSSSVAPGQADA